MHGWEASRDPVQTTEARIAPITVSRKIWEVKLGVEAVCRGGAALFAVAHLTSTLATRSPEWRLSVTLYQLPTCHQHSPTSPLCVLSLCSHPASSSFWGLLLSLSCSLFDSLALCLFFFLFPHSLSLLASLYSDWLVLKLSSYLTLLSPPHFLS